MLDPSLKLRYISFLKTKLKERNNSVFGMAIEITRSDYGLRCACVFIKIQNYIASSPPRGTPVNSKAQQF